MKMMWWYAPCVCLGITCKMEHVEVRKIYKQTYLTEYCINSIASSNII